MFTGIIADVGRLEAFERHAKGARLRVRTALPLSEVAEGDSVAVNGVCLTALGIGGGVFSADLSQETIERSSFQQARVGDPVNLELALRVGDRLGGHMVQGHVDGVGRLVERREVGESWDVAFEVPERLLGEIVEKGSIALDGISLTVARLEGARVTIAVIPHTGAKTTILSRRIGSLVNVETDVIGKYVLRALGRMSGGSEGGLSLQTLKDNGFA